MNTRTFNPGARCGAILSLCSLAALVLLAGCGTVPLRLSNPLDYVDPPQMIYLGPVVGLNRNFHSGGFAGVADPACVRFGSGSGEGYLLGLSGEFLLERNGASSLVPRVTFDQRPGAFSQHLVNASVLMQAGHEPVEQAVTATSTITYRLISAEILFKQDIARLAGLPVSVAAGPAVSYVVGGSNRQTLDLVTPVNARFLNLEGLPAENNGRRLITYDAGISGRKDLRVSLKAGVQTELGLFGYDWVLTPGLYYDIGLTDVTSSESWHLNSLLFAVDFRHAF